MECFQWDSYIGDSDCLKKSLTNNLWATDDELSSKNEAEVKNLLIEKLNFYWDGEIHSIVDLSMREISGDSDDRNKLLLMLILRILNISHEN